jgi:hypothetical protein
MRALRTRHGVEISQAMFLTAGIERLTNATSQNRSNDIPRALGCRRYTKTETEKLFSGGARAAITTGQGRSAALIWPKQGLISSYQRVKRYF